MNVLAALALVEATSVPLPPSAGRTAVAVFRSACVEGHVRLSKKEVRPIKRNNMPAVVLRQLSRFPSHLTSNTQFYELAMPEGQAFLVIQPGTGRRNRGQYCSVASNRIKYWDARVAIEQHPQNLAMISASERRSMERMGYSRTVSTFGYETELRRIDGFIVMTTFLPARKTAH